MSAYKRVVLKLSGEALAGGKGFGIDAETVQQIALQIKSAYETGVEIAIIVGGGNIWRGKTASEMGMERSSADYMGMLATVMNALALQNALEACGIQTRTQTSIHMNQIAEPYIRRRAIRHLEKGRIVIFGGGTGNPYFSTDTTTVLRAIEIEAETILLAKAVDGVYDSDPAKNPDAVKYDTVTIKEVVDKRLAVIDMTASIMCMENHMPLAVFGLNEENSIANALNGKITGTHVTA